MQVLPWEERRHATAGAELGSLAVLQDTGEQVRRRVADARSWCRGD